MAEAPVTHDEREFATEFNAVVENYAHMEKQIHKFGGINVTKKLETFLSQFHGRDKASVFISGLVKDAAEKYRRVEDEAKKYVQMAKCFAEENIDAVEGVKDNKYSAEEVLSHLKVTAKDMKKKFDSVVEEHHRILDSVKEAERKAKAEKEEWRKSKEIADTVFQVACPGIGVATGAKILGEKAAEAVDDKAGKLLLGTAGGIAGTLLGIISGVLIIPAVAGLALRTRYKSWEKEFGDIASSLHEVDAIISQHKSTLADICHHFDGLCQKYEALQTRLVDKKPIILTLDQISRISKRLGSACKVYLETIENETIGTRQDAAGKLPATDPNPLLPIQCCSECVEGEEHDCK